MEVTLLVPTLNEITGMRHIMPRIDPSWCSQVLVVDGSSTDGTVGFARQCGYDVLEQRKQGLRHAYAEALPLVRGDVVITFSPDGNCLPALIPQLIAKMSEGYDMVIASRYVGGLKSEDDDFITAFGNWMFTRLINTLHGGRYTDAMGIYRAWRRDVFWSLDLDKDDAYAPEKPLGTILGVEPLLSVRAAKRKLRCADIPGPEPRRISGERKLQVARWGAAYLLQVLREVYYWR